MKVFTIDYDLNGHEVIVEHDVRKLNGIPGEMHAECYGKTDAKPYYLHDGKDRIFLSENQAISAMDSCRQAG